MALKGVLSKSRYMVLVPVVLSLVASAGAFIWGAYRTMELLYHLFHDMATGEGGHGIIGLISIMDTYLIATALLIFSVGLYELFIEEVDLPEWLVIHDLHDLKAKLGSVIILVMSVSFLERLVRWEGALDTFLYAAAIALISAVLIAFAYFGGKD